MRLRVGLRYLEGVVASTMGTNGLIDMEIVSSYQFQMIDNIEMVRELEAVGVGIGGQGVEDLPDLTEDLGFIAAAVENVVG